MKKPSVFIINDGSISVNELINIVLKIRQQGINVRVIEEKDFSDLGISKDVLRARQVIQKIFGTNVKVYNPENN